jgi:glutamate dehydrogenase
VSGVADSVPSGDEDELQVSGVTRRVEAARTLLLTIAAEQAGPDADLLARYYRHVAADDLLDRDVNEVLSIVRGHRSLAGKRPQGVAVVDVHNPGADNEVFASHRTVVEVVTDDMPFLVDSVSAALGRLGHAIHLVVHPVLVVRRDLMGELREVLDVEFSDAPTETDVVVESWIRVEIDRIADAAGREAVRSSVAGVLGDVREAVEDWSRMRHAAKIIAEELGTSALTSGSAETAEAAELINWLIDGNFTFLGYREYDLGGPEGDESLAAIAGTGLGILRFDQTVSSAFAKLPPWVRSKAREQVPLIMTKANSISTVHRSTYLDYIGVKRFGVDGAVIGERRFLGLFSSVAYTQSVRQIPVLRRKAAAVLEQAGLTENSHSGKDLLQFLETYPRDELFQVTVNDLVAVSEEVLHLQERRQTRLFLRRDSYGRFVSCLVYLPRDRYTTTVRLRIAEILRTALNGESVDYTARVTESVLARLHFVVRLTPGMQVAEVDADELESRLAHATHSWDDDVALEIAADYGEDAATELINRYGNAFPESYKEDFPATTAVTDLARLDRLTSDGEPGYLLYEPSEKFLGRRFKVYRIGAPISLSVVLPVLQSMGVEVVDERPYEILRADGSVGWIYDFGLRFDPERVVGIESLRERFEAAFAAAWLGAAESDGFNALVLASGLTWREATVIRAYARYLRQTGYTFSQGYVERVAAARGEIIRQVLDIFTARFDPDLDGDRAEVAEQRLRDFEATLDTVASLDEDRILRSFGALVQATLRTNYYQPDAEGKVKSYVSFKFDPRAVPDLPLPRPRFEIWVYSPQVEGVHLRFGRVARGGLRWSDRHEDFRTEVLGLVKAQMVKNAVIVPVGAKGGFVVRRPPVGVDREAVLAEGIACYRTFVSGLLDITDNLVAGNVVPPERVVRHDPDDTYLVVAADKGTATFSDIANAVARDYGFWLGDAFASGGSVGYDHKVMGITARGAWESVKRHFRELGRNTQSQEFTVVGIGDMSGDVFGNGMLLSDHIRLVAAFDHRHIFLDPNPAAASSFAERRRLFDLPRSSWADYNIALSQGGGIYPRSTKSIPITPEVRESLGLPDGVEAMSPDQLLRAILLAPVDLLWNGGIGTYVKSSSETNAQVGDKANDAIRVDGRQLRARVVGEGGNLGLTQLGRVEAARSGVMINTDAIDNSAGVDTSDHEVNIKILLDQAVRDGDLDYQQRNEFLASMTDEVAAHVLRDNYEQNILLGVARIRANLMLPVHRRFINQLVERGILDRDIEFIPSDAALAQRYAAGEGLTSPELAVLLAYAKISVTDDLNESMLADNTWFEHDLRSYFPPQLVDRFGDRLASHPLRRQIIGTLVTNELINRGGITAVFRAAEETGASSVEIAKAYAVVTQVFDFPSLWERIEALDNLVPMSAQRDLIVEARRLLDRACRWLLQVRGGSIDVAAEVERFGAPIAKLSPLVSELLVGNERARLERRTGEFVEKGAPQDLAREVAGQLDEFALLDVVEIARSTDIDPEEAARVYFAVSERYEIDLLLHRITGLPRADRWATLARSALRSDLYSALAGLTTSVVRLTPDGLPAAERIARWEGTNSEGLTRARATLDEILGLESQDVATLSVALRTIRNLSG